MEKSIYINKGDCFVSNSGDRFEVLEYINCRNVIIRFIETGSEQKYRASHIVEGRLRDKLKRSWYGVGYQGVGKYKTTKNSGHYKAHVAWRNMLKRCYCEKFHKKNKSYVNCVVCDEWHNMQTFISWYMENYPSDGGDYDLDKDILSSKEKIYSPSTCMFVTREDNMKAVFKGRSN